MSDMETLRKKAGLPVRVVPAGDRGSRLFIGDEEFVYPVEADSMRVTRAGRRMNRLTLTLFVGEVTFETNGEPVGSECTAAQAEGNSWLGRIGRLIAAHHRPWNRRETTHDEQPSHAQDAG